MTTYNLVDLLLHFQLVGININATTLNLTKLLITFGFNLVQFQMKIDETYNVTRLT
jgi:hypothetical protein